jgi:hypothetical protein
MQEFSSVKKFHSPAPKLEIRAPRERGPSHVDRFSECSPAAGTIATFNLRNVGMSRWQLSDQITTLVDARERGGMSVVGPFRPRLSRVGVSVIRRLSAAPILCRRGS